VLFAMPLIGGLVADAAGLRTVFAIAAGGAAVGTALMLRVREPRTPARLLTRSPVPRENARASAKD